MPEPDFDMPLRPSKHMRNTWMRKWNWDMRDLRTALKEAFNVEKVGRDKYEIYTRYKADEGKSRKLILVAYSEEIFVITGAEGTG